MQAIQVSTILKPRGLKGEIKCRFFAPVPEKIYIDEVQYEVTKSGVYKDFTYLYLEGIDSIETAERLRGKEIMADRADIVAADEILITDLIGFTVKDEKGKNFGKILSTDNFGAGDILNLESMSIPYEDDFIIETNITNKTIVVKLH